MVIDYLGFCKAYFWATGIPISLICADKEVYSSMGEVLSLPSQEHWETFSLEQVKQNPVFGRYSPDIEYGIVQVEGTDYQIVLGPYFSVPVTEQIVREFMIESMIPPDRQDEVHEYLYGIPQITRARFGWHLNLIHMSVNEKQADFNELFSQADLPSEQMIQTQILRRQEEAELEDTPYDFDVEHQIFHLIREGDGDTLKKLLTSDAVSNLPEGQLAASPLRHAKNLVITAITKACSQGMIPGGVAEDKARELMNLYIRECEQKRTIDEVYALQYSMLLYFCRCVQDAKIPKGVSPDIYACANYIRSHINEPLSLDDIARNVMRSTSYVTKRFKVEMGINVGAYITECRLEQAKSLLLYSDKSLSEISNYLCFSNQPYFQTVFKKRYGMTPAAFRKQREQS